MARRRLGFQSSLSILMRFAFAIVIALSVGCAFRRPVDLSATNEDKLYTTTPLANATLYHHHWPGFPCYSIKLSGQSWRLMDTSAARVRWRKENTILSVFFTDNRLTHFSTVLAPGERVLRDFLGYELSYVRPSFSLHTSQPPRFANNGNGDWMQWAWQGLGGQVYDGEIAPADQRHVIANLWLEPWVMSFDWATERLYTINGPTPEMIDVLDSLEFDPACNG